MRRNASLVRWIGRGCIRILGRLLFGRSCSGIEFGFLAFRLFFLSWKRGFRYCSLQAAKICYWNWKQVLAVSRWFLSGFEPRASLSSEIFAPAPGSAKQAISLLL